MDDKDLLKNEEDYPARSDSSMDDKDGNGWDARHSRGRFRPSMDDKDGLDGIRWPNKRILFRFLYGRWTLNIAYQLLYVQVQIPLWTIRTPS